MDIAITGANGFVGEAVVRAALARGHRVRALLRRGRTLPPGLVAPDLLVHAVGLEDSPELEAALAGSEVVIHVAAALRGNLEQQRADSAGLTRQLLAAMRRAGVRRLVGISSFALYDYDALPENAVLDENSPIESQPARRGAYAQAKLEQEQVFRDFGAESGHGAAILRPGVVYDESRLLALTTGKALGGGAWLSLGPDSPIALVHVDDVAGAIVLAAENPAADGQVLNLVEQDPPRRHALVRRLAAPRRVLHFPWWLHRTLAALASTLLRAAGRRVPGALDPVELAVRFKPLRYENARARQVLGWAPRHRADDVGRAG